jgi:hypothetical protein
LEGLPARQDQERRPPPPPQQPQQPQQQQQQQQQEVEGEGEEVRWRGNEEAQQHPVGSSEDNALLGAIGMLQEAARPINVLSVGTGPAVQRPGAAGHMQPPPPPLHQQATQQPQAGGEGAEGASPTAAQVAGSEPGAREDFLQARERQVSPLPHVPAVAPAPASAPPDLGTAADPAVGAAGAGDGNAAAGGCGAPFSTECAALGAADAGLAALRAAEAAEAALAAPPKSQSSRQHPLSALSALLADAPMDWNSQGRPDAAGAMVGGAVLLRLEELSAVVGDLGEWWAAHGRPQAIAAAGQFVAVGTSSGAAVMLQLPPAHAAAAQAGGGAPAAGGAQQAASNGPAVWALGEGARPELGPVTALGFSQPAGAQDALWLAVGHASGVVGVWEIQRRGAKNVATIGGR